MSEIGAGATTAGGSRDQQSQLLTIDLSERQTDELVIGLVGAIGSGVSKTAEIIARLLEREYNYSCHCIKVSQVIREMGEKLDEKGGIVRLPANRRRVRILG